jgi:hypothetical protein
MDTKAQAILDLITEILSNHVGQENSISGKELQHTFYDTADHEDCVGEQYRAGLAFLCICGDVMTNPVGDYWLGQ